MMDEESKNIAYVEGPFVWDDMVAQVYAAGITDFNEQVKTADSIIDLGPEGGDKGGTVIAEGSPEEVCQVPGSFTGEFLKPVLERTRELMRKKGPQDDRRQKEMTQQEALEIAIAPKPRRRRKPLEE